jgi:hypothetical protein
MQPGQIACCYCTLIRLKSLLANVFLFFTISKTNHFMKKLLLSFAILLGFSASSFAHVWELWITQSNTGVITLYGQTWHNNTDPFCAADPGDGLMVNGTLYQWDALTWTNGDVRTVPNLTLLCSDPAPDPFDCADSRCSYISLSLGVIAPGTPLVISAAGNDQCFLPSAGLLSNCTATVPQIPNPAPCGKNGQKVELSHMTGSVTNPCVTICISAEDVADHLAHGDTYGPCPAARMFGDASETVLVAPNPNSGTFTVTLGNEETSTIRVVDMVGKTVYTQTTNSSSVYVDLSQYPKGLYFVEVNNGAQNHKAKVLIQ